MKVPDNRTKSEISYFTKKRQIMCLNWACLGREQLQQVDRWPEWIKIESTNQSVRLALLRSSLQASARIEQSRRQYMNLWKSESVSYDSILIFRQNAKELELLSNEMHGDWWISYRFYFFSKSSFKTGSNAFLKMCFLVMTYSKKQGRGRHHWIKRKFLVSGFYY